MSSRHHHSSSHRHRSHQSSRSSESHSSSNSEDLVEQVKNIVTLLYEVVLSRPHEWENYLESARSAVTALEHLRFFKDASRYAEQIWIIQGLQDYAYHDADDGSIKDIAEFCQKSWLRVLRNYPENVETLTGLGRNWLQGSQATLVKIHYEESYDSSSGGSSSAADPRRQGPLYVEARGYLQPAVDFYSRAVRAADAQGTTTGELLSSAAESQMSLGNVSTPPADERLFTQAIRYLRRAEAVPGFTLSVYMQQYLNDYGRYVS